MSGKRHDVGCLHFHALCRNVPSFLPKVDLLSTSANQFASANKRVRHELHR
jgi:hypothetical protein